MGIVHRFASVVLSASLLATAPAIAAFQVLAAAGDPDGQIARPEGQALRSVGPL